MKFVAYNACTSKFITFEVENYTDIPGYFWDVCLIHSDDDFEDWEIWRVEKPLTVKVVSQYMVE